MVSAVVVVGSSGDRDDDLDTRMTMMALLVKRGNDAVGDTGYY